MSHVVRKNLSEQILLDFEDGLDLSPPQYRQGQEILAENDEFLNESSPVPFLYEDSFHEEE
jgi:hypothetical protein